MDGQSIITRLRAHEAELRQAGVQSLSLFGSAARGDAGAESDVDVAVRLSDDFARGGFEYFGRLQGLRQRLRQIVGGKVDLVEEPVERRALRAAIDEDRARAF